MTLITPGGMQRALSTGLIGFIALASAALAADIRWIRLSSKSGDLPDPAGSNQQTGLLVANLDKGKTTGFVISFRVKGPALVWYRRAGNAWARYVIEKDFLTLEAGGAWI